MIRLLPSGAQIRVAALLGGASLKILKFKWFLCAPLALGIVAMKSYLVVVRIDKRPVQEQDLRYMDDLTVQAKSRLSETIARVLMSN